MSHFNFPAFDVAAARMRALGRDPVNPADGGLTRQKAVWFSWGRSGVIEV